MFKKVFKLIAKFWSAVSGFISEHTRGIVLVLLWIATVLSLIVVASTILDSRTQYLAFKNPTNHESRLGTQNFRFTLRNGWDISLEVDKEEGVRSCLYYMDIDAYSKDYFLLLRKDDPEPWRDLRKFIHAYPQRASVEVTADRDKVVYGYNKTFTPFSECEQTFTIKDGRKIVFEIYAETDTEGLKGLNIVKTPTGDHIGFVVYLTVLAGVILFWFFTWVVDTL
jgi:hypothetical protein